MKPRKNLDTFWILFLLSFSLVGCQVPTKQLSTYREALQAARTAGESILLDHASARKEYDDLVAQRNLVNPPPQKDAVRLAFDSSQVGPPPADAIVVRMKAWAVVASYSEALTALAEGRPADELSGAFDGLVKAIGVLSADAATGVLPFAGIIKTALNHVQRAVEVKKFRQAVTDAQDLMVELEKLLVADADNFYNIRLGLRNLAFSAKQDQAVDLRDRSIALMVDHTQARQDGSLDANAAVEAINQQLHRIPNWDAADDLDLGVEGSTDYSALTEAQMVANAAAIGRFADEAIAIDAKLLSYRETMTRYVLLVHAVTHTHHKLLEAVENPKAPLNGYPELIKLIIGVRQAFNTYQSQK